MRGMTPADSLYVSLMGLVHLLHPSSHNRRGIVNKSVALLNQTPNKLQEGCYHVGMVIPSGTTPKLTIHITLYELV